MSEQSLRAHAQRKKTKESLKAAYVFFFFVGGLILLSLFFKVVLLLKETKFDGSSHFSLEIQNKKTENIQIISFSPQNSSIGILDVQGLNPRSLEIPVDAKIDSDKTIESGNIKTSLLTLLLNSDEKEINFVDVLKLFLFSQTVKDNSISEKNINDRISEVNVDSLVSQFFVDPKISNEKLTIEIVNSTNVSGLGNRLANYVSNMGGNVILVSNGDEQKESEIDYSNDSYTVDKLSSMLNLNKVKIPKKSLSDVIIIIGDNSLKKLNF